MPKFILVADITITVHTEVDAESLEDAMAEAEARPVVRIREDGAVTQVWCTSGELDGTPENIRAEE